MRSFHWIFRREGAVQWWNEYRSNSSDDFQEYTDGLIREAEAAE